MAFTGSVGFDGPLYEVGWARLAAMLGRYAVASSDDWRVTAVPGERQVTIARGEGLGSGVLTTTDADEVKDIPTPTSATRWYLATARRVWETDTCTFEILPGGTESTMPTAWPAEFQSTPGLVDDQPLAWVKASATSNALTVVDLRTLPPEGPPPLGSALISTGTLAAYGTVFTGPKGDEQVDVAECWFNLAVTTKVRIEAVGQWYSTGIAAGTHSLRIGSEQLVPPIRAHNEGRTNTPQTLTTSAVHVLPAGRHRVLLTAGTEKTSAAPRRIGMVRINVWKD